FMLFDVPSSLIYHIRHFEHLSSRKPNSSPLPPIRMKRSVSPEEVCEVVLQSGSHLRELPTSAD
uniref:T-box domain-containing protein n=1 Tax=Parascaris univalens TaxID=6257 RepID=A0A915AQN1_PARUN